MVQKGNTRAFQLQFYPNLVVRYRDVSLRITLIYNVKLLNKSAIYDRCAEFTWH